MLKVAELFVVVQMKENDFGQVNYIISKDFRNCQMINYIWGKHIWMNHMMFW